MKLIHKVQGAGVNASFVGLDETRKFLVGKEVTGKDDKGLEVAEFKEDGGTLTQWTSWCSASIIVANPNWVSIQLEILKRQKRDSF